MKVILTDQDVTLFEGPLFPAPKVAARGSRAPQFRLGGAGVPAAAATAPAQFANDQWSVATGLEPNQIVMNISALPNNGGSAITALQYNLGAGWVTLEGVGTGARTLTMASAGTGYTFTLRAVNSVGAGAASGTKNATSGAAATEPDVIPTIADISDQAMTVGDADRVIALQVTNAASIEVSPSGAGVTISGTSLTISATTERSGSYTVTVTSSTGNTASDSFALTVAAAAQTETAPTMTGGSLEVE